MSKVIDEDVLEAIDAAMLLSSAIGSLELLRSREPAKHTRRHREITKTLDSLNGLLQCYPRSLEYDLVRLGHRFFARIESELEIIRKQGLVAHGDVVDIKEVQ